MSRKTIFVFLGAILLFLKTQFGLAINDVAFLGVMVYLFGEAKVDLKRIITQADKFKDPKFWLALVTTLLPLFNELFGLNIPIEAVVAVLTLILSLLFGKDYVAAKKLG